MSYTFEFIVGFVCVCVCVYVGGGGGGGEVVFLYSALCGLMSCFGGTVLYVCTGYHV